MLQTALAIGAFATTLTSLSFALSGWRGLSVTNVFIGDFFFVAGIGMLISAQWEIVRGNSFAYTVLSAFGKYVFCYRSTRPEYIVLESVALENSTDDE